MKEREDHSLWQEFLMGNKDAFAQLYLRYHPLLLHYGLRLCGDESRAEEHIQGLFCYLFEQREQLPLIQHLKAYLFVAYRRRIFQKTRTVALTDSQVEQVSDISFSREELIIKAENQSAQHKKLHLLLNELPWRQKEIIYLRYYNGLTNQEIAKVLNINHQSVLNALYKAFKKLRKAAHKKKMTPFFFWFW